MQPCPRPRTTPLLRPVPPPHDRPDNPVDFALSAGAFDKTLIEFKLAKSSSLKRNLAKQLEIYLEANKTPHGVKVIISYSDTDHARAVKVLDELGIADSRYVTLVDARATNKPSASVA